MSSSVTDFCLLLEFPPCVSVSEKDFLLELLSLSRIMGVEAVRGGLSDIPESLREKSATLIKIK